MKNGPDTFMPSHSPGPHSAYAYKVPQHNQNAPPQTLGFVMAADGLTVIARCSKFADAVLFAAACDLRDAGLDIIAARPDIMVGSPLHAAVKAMSAAICKSKGR